MKTNDEKRKRGRPKGWRKRDHSQLLHAMALIIFNKPGTKIATAAKMAGCAYEDTILRDVRRRWNCVGKELLEQLRQEKRRKELAVSRRPAALGGAYAVLEHAAIVHRIAHSVALPDMTALKAVMKTMRITANPKMLALLHGPTRHTAMTTARMALFPLKIR